MMLNSSDGGKHHDIFVCVIGQCQTLLHCQKCIWSLGFIIRPKKSKKNSICFISKIKVLILLLHLKRLKLCLSIMSEKLTFKIILMISNIPFQTINHCWVLGSLSTALADRWVYILLASEKCFAIYFWIVDVLWCDLTSKQWIIPRMVKA